MRVVSAARALLFAAALLLAAGTPAESKRSETINVHLVCHTHDDVGWLKTVDQYYLGSRNSIQHAGVQWILNSVIPQLQADPTRKFIYVEIGFFSRWWNEQTPDMQQTVRTLVKNGQFEFINGGWCMNDEATTHYTDIIDQMALGHSFLKETFGVTPRIGWHIDPFGHSSVQATLFAQMGFDGFFFGRADFRDKSARMNSKRMEFIWRGSPSLGQAQEMFTGLNFNLYQPPDGFCFDEFCNDEPINDDPAIYGNNIGQRALGFGAQVEYQASFYRTNNILLTMGSDFMYENANMWYQNLDKLIRYFQQHPDMGINVFYSTPSQYLDSLYKANLTWTVKRDDFFPYADGVNAYWTGYFVSRPALKGYVREMSSYLQTCRQLEAFGLNPGPRSSFNLWQAMGIAQHHDAVAGTEKQQVAYDYALRLGSGQTDCANITNGAFDTLVNPNAVGTVSFSQCPLTNESICDPTTYLSPGQATAVLIYNPIARARDYIVRVPLPSNYTNITVQDENGETVVSQIISSGPSIRINSQPFLLVFVSSLPPLGYSTYFVTVGSSDADGPVPMADAEPLSDGDPITISSSRYSVEFDSTSGLMTSITNNLQQTTVSSSQQLLWWNSSCGNSLDGQNSGAYIFRPNASDAYQIAPSASVTVSVGPVVEEVHQIFSTWAQQTVRLWQGTDVIEVEYHIGPIPVADRLGKEIISRFSTSIANNGTFFTDANGREMRERVRNNRSDFPYYNNQPAAGNYYPINSAAYLQDIDSGARLTVVTDRSQGGSSLHDGELEIMLHRRTLCDDGRGVGEPINEPGYTGQGLVIRARHLLVLDSAVNSSDIQRRVEQEQTYKPVVAFAQIPGGDVSNWRASYRTSWSASAQPLPPNVHLLTVQQTSDPNQVILRLAHMFEVNESPLNSGPVTVDLTQIFAPNLVTVLSAEELSLSANQPLSDVHRLQWNSDSVRPGETGYKQSPLRKTVDPSGSVSLPVELQPQEIRTFLVTIQQPLDE